MLWIPSNHLNIMAAIKKIEGHTILIMNVRITTIITYRYLPPELSSSCTDSCAYFQRKRHKILKISWHQLPTEITITSITPITSEMTSRWKLSLMMQVISRKYNDRPWKTLIFRACLNRFPHFLSNLRVENCPRLICTNSIVYFWCSFKALLRSFWKENETHVTMQGISRIFPQVLLLNHRREITILFL